MAKKSAVRQVSDPYQVPVTFVNAIESIGTINGVVNVTLSVARFMPDGAHVTPDIVIASRLRFDLQTALAMRDAINTQLALAAAPEGKAN